VRVTVAQEAVPQAEAEDGVVAVGDVTHPDTPTRQIHTRASQPGSDTTQANTRSRPTGEFAHPTTAPTTQTNTLPNPVVVQQVNNTNTVGLTSTAATSATLAPPGELCCGRVFVYTHMSLFYHEEWPEVRVSDALWAAVEWRCRLFNELVVVCLTSWLLAV
ncbi:hypothetical protein SARC_17903, partial [Sphaeroforma arctica JP610]